MAERKRSRVCVTGGAGFIGSWLVKKLLEKGYIVHATLRNLGDETKTGILKNLPGADTRLELFEADIYDADRFQPAIKGCEYVFLVATPLQHNHDNAKYKDSSEAAVDAIKSIIRICEQTGTVKRVIYTGSVTSASPLQEDGSGFGNQLDESCWTPLNISYGHSEEREKAYVLSKTQSEKEVLSYNERQERKGIEVVSLTCALVGGETILPYVPMSIAVLVSPLTADSACHRTLMFLQALLGSVPLAHIDDICEAHIFCAENPSMAGRFLCASVYPTMKEIMDYYEQKHAGLLKIKEFEKEPHATVKCTSTKLNDIGFKYKYDAAKTIDESVECAKRLGLL